MADYYSQMKQRESVAEANTAFREPPARLTFCVVTAVDIQNRAVTIKHAGSSLEETNVSYTSLSANSKAGQDNIPSKGDVAVVASTATGTKIILGFVGGSNRSGEVALKEGDMLSKSLGDSIIKQDADGNIFICTKDGSHLLLTKTGDFKLYASSIDIETPFLKITDHEVSGVPYQKKEIFRSKPSVASTTNETMHLLLEGGAPSFEPRFPVITEHLGAKVDPDGNLSLLDVGLIPKKEIIHSTEIRNKDTGAVVYSEEIDSDGNMRISGGKIVIDGMTPSNPILPMPKVVTFKNRVTLNANATVVPVGINSWAPTSDDTLLVFVGGIFQTEGVEYTFNTVNKTIIGSWDEGFVIDFLVMQTGSEEDLSGFEGEYVLTSFKNRVLLNFDSTAIPVGISEWSPTTDAMFVVFVGGVYQVEGAEYTVDAANKTIVGSWTEGTTIDFLVTKYVQSLAPSIYLDGNMLNPDSVDRSALSATLKAELDGLAGLIATNGSPPVPVTLSSGFLAGWGGTLSCRKTSENFVNLKIDLAKSTDISAAGESLVLIPVGYRPSSPIVVLVNLFNGSSVSVANSFAYLYIGTDGTLIVQPITGTTLTNARYIRHTSVSYFA